MLTLSSHLYTFSYLLLLPHKTILIDLICYYFAITNFLNNGPNFTGWRLACNWIWRTMCLCVIACVGELGVVTIHICLSLSLSLCHTLTNTHCICVMRMQGVSTAVCLCRVSECICGERYFCMCVYPGHIVWTGRMRMDGIVITEWRYPHSVKLEKAGQKPPTGTGGKERVVVMVIGEFKQGFTNL